ncbi:symmetrical bis(5'-nucleosyl)-tetraphosphatase [Blochmannia endosymbiont of Polyrhachis (Hedomyrma) turneri]|uniref:symmetrical bis(5'-nucleosyl)-tetraphosphatase n=1 Tax=Blochmannia endosymbiont of Polyrhachis (Hedomyrma) turneri TaxID=1505596 RepID=UPI00061A7F1C|nr:symmetrical bis(5'-nucleosyl)-tetraphosphatase [Blochmannia endosymbiont of Polyrhachis (Hedomyrma) turneri]AKC59708.1 Bis(5'-nucleosyl)-tetraphosphatase [symmetrical] [Blochmannia endosymbiont of Polyrhachis (Hedomyrma) turneri]
MSTYLIGDIHGCYTSLKKILNTVKFNPKIDTLWITGDLVAKGPHSLEVLNLIYKLKNSVRIVLGNHDLNLLRSYANFNYRYKKKYACHTNIFQSSHADKLINWLRYQPMLQIDESKKIIMTHAGITPTWTICAAKKNAKEIEKILQSKHYAMFLQNIQSTKITTTHSLLNVQDKNLTRIIHNINIFTKMRYLYPDGQLDLKFKDIPEKSPYPLQPWFNLPRLIPSCYNIIFGHWSTLEGKGTPDNIYGLDSGCYRGKQLTLLQWENKNFIRISCTPRAL